MFKKKIVKKSFDSFLTFFDGRDFEPGTFVQKRADSKDADKGGIVNFKFPQRGEPALVVGHCAPAQNPHEAYQNCTLVVLVFDDDNEPVRFAVDPVMFEVYTGK